MAEFFFFNQDLVSLAFSALMGKVAEKEKAALKASILYSLPSMSHVS